MTTAAAIEEVAHEVPRDRGTRVIVYHHTHWDREWWTTRRDFSVRLADLIDDVLDILDADPTFTTFVLDGQAHRARGLPRAGATPARARLRPFRAPSSVRRLNLAEKPIDDQPIALVDGWAEIEAHAWQLVTIGFSFE
jgi:hypothetical protein